MYYHYYLFFSTNLTTVDGGRLVSFYQTFPSITRNDSRCTEIPPPSYQDLFPQSTTSMSDIPKDQSQEQLNQFLEEQSQDQQSQFIAPQNQSQVLQENQPPRSRRASTQMSQ